MKMKRNERNGISRREIIILNSYLDGYVRK